MGKAAKDMPMGDEARFLLDRFVTDNDDLEKLSARLGGINFFSILRLEEHEIRHSNVIAWLLDPSESHGIGDAFVKGFLSKAILDSEQTTSISAASIQLMDFRTSKVWREESNIDVLIRDDANRIVILIENKIRAKESQGQLARYLARAKESHPGYRVIPLFLTLNGDGSSDEEAKDYIPCNYTQVLGVLTRILDRRKGRLSPAATIFLEHYQEILRRLLMEDKELVDLCKAIYAKHRDAIDLINRYGSVDDFVQAATDAVSNGAYRILRAGSTYFCFVPERWIEFLPENGTAWEHSPNVSIQFFFNRSEDRVWLKFEVSKMTDPKLRMKCVEELRKAGFKLTEAAFRPDATYSRFYNASVRINGEDGLKNALEQLLREAFDPISKAEGVLKKVFK